MTMRQSFIGISLSVSTPEAKLREPARTRIARRPPNIGIVIASSTSRDGSAESSSPSSRTSENYGIDAQYNLIEIASNKSVMTGSTFSRVSYDIPGQLQRFARTRAFRDAEDRAAQEIAENIQTRLASFFVAGT